MTKKINLIFFLILFSSCSFHSGGGFWTKQEKLDSQDGEFKSLIIKQENPTKEFNKSFNLRVKKGEIKVDPFINRNNNDGFNLFKSNIEKITKYNFSKIKNYHLFDPNLIFHNENVLFFDSKGTILKFDKNSKLVWKSNNYSKDEKKTGPLITLANYKDKLIVADNFAKIYLLDILNGKILWTKKNEIPFNSEIKVLKDKFFVIDTHNNLNCFSLKDGSKIWSFSTERSFVNSFKKLSIIFKDQSVIFNNSLGDITAVDIINGSLLWQISTQNSKIFEDIMSLKTSELVENNNSIYFSNNKNQFFSIDINSGAINWIQNISSNVKPGILGSLLLTISDDGYFFVIDKKSGNIIRITDIFNQIKSNKKKKIYPIGFIFNLDKLFISTSNGRVIVTDIKNGQIDRIIKIDNDKISRPFVKNQNMYLIKSNSIVKLN